MAIPLFGVEPSPSRRPSPFQSFSLLLSPPVSLSASLALCRDPACSSEQRSIPYLEQRSNPYLTTLTSPHLTSPHPVGSFEHRLEPFELPSSNSFMVPCSPPLYLSTSLPLYLSTSLPLYLSTSSLPLSRSTSLPLHLSMLEALSSKPQPTWREDKWAKKNMYLISFTFLTTTTYLLNNHLPNIMYISLLLLLFLPQLLLLLLLLPTTPFLFQHPR